MNTLRNLLLVLLLAIGTEAVAQNFPQIPVNRGTARRPIPGDYIITLQDGVDPAAVAAEHGLLAKFVYRQLISGLAVTMTEGQRQRLLRDPRVVRIEQDQIVTADQSVSWNLDRIDQRRLPLSGSYTRNYTGQGVTVYVLDGGIRYDHVELGGRASFGYDVFGGNGSDCSGHGTHVASTIGGNTYGVANRVSLVSVKVLDCNGSGAMSGMIAAMDWIAANRRLPAVANMSLGGTFVQAMNDAVTRLTNRGVAVVVAAGNENVNACNTSPASAPDAITVAASDQNDARASFSNYGSCVDFFAPGVMIPGAYYTASNSYVYMSGTSMAAPHVAGAAALILQHNPSIAARTLRDQLYSYTTRGVVSGSLSTNNHLLYSLEQIESGVTPTPTNTPPTANFSQSCSGLGCTFTDLSTDANGTIVAWLWNFGNGVTSTVKNPSYTYPAAGSYTVTLQVTDNGGATASTSRVVSVSSPTNTPPTANFSQSCSGLGCTFTDLSTDANGTVVAWLWNFGNGVTSTVKNPSYTYPAAGSYTVTLQVTDNGGATATTSKVISVSSPTNTPPTASFSVSCTGLGCTFTDRSTDPNGSIVSWRWNFGNGVTSTAQHPTYTYPASGTYTVTLTVTDNAGAMSTATANVTVSVPTTPTISLTLRGYKVYGYEYVELRWSGATSSYVDIYMNGSRIGTVSNSGGVTHRTNLTGPRTLTYKVCNSGTTTCSANQSVTFY